METINWLSRIKNKFLMRKIHYIGQKTIQLYENETKDGTPQLSYHAYDAKSRYGIAKKNNEYVAHILNQYFEKLGIVSIAKDYGESLKWPFAFFIDQFDAFNNDDVNVLVNKSLGFIKYKYENTEFVCMFDNLHGTLVKMKMEVTETPEKVLIKMYEVERHGTTY